MTDRDRLIELLKQGNRECSQKSLAEIKKILDEKHSYNSETDKPFNLWEALADYLLANGVIVPPCKVGDTVYIVKSYTNSYLEIVSREVISTLVKEIIVNENGISIMTEEAEYAAEHIGKFVFFTKEEAEEKLKELGK